MNNFTSIWEGEREKNREGSYLREEDRKEKKDLIWVTNGSLQASAESRGGWEAIFRENNLRKPRVSEQARLEFDLVAKEEKERKIVLMNQISKSPKVYQLRSVPTVLVGAV